MCRACRSPRWRHLWCWRTSRRGSGCSRRCRRCPRCPGRFPAKKIFSKINVIYDGSLFLQCVIKIILSLSKIKNRAEIINIAIHVQQISSPLGSGSTRAPSLCQSGCHTFPFRTGSTWCWIWLPRPLRTCRGRTAGTC